MPRLSSSHLHHRDVLLHLRGHVHHGCLLHLRGHVHRGCLLRHRGHALHGHQWIRWSDHGLREHVHRDDARLQMPPLFH